MTAEDALKIIVDLLEQAGPADVIQRDVGSRELLADIGEIAFCYDSMDRAAWGTCSTNPQ
jgi:hypothetical protein